MYLRYEKDGKFTDVFDVSRVRWSHGFVECLSETGSVVAFFSQDCPYQVSSTPFFMTFDDVVSRVIRYSSTFREVLSRSDYLKLYAALNDLRQDKN